MDDVRSLDVENGPLYSENNQVLEEEGNVLVMYSVENTLSCKWVPITLTRAALSDYRLISSSFHAW